MLKVFPLWVYGDNLSSLPNIWKSRQRRSVCRWVRQ